jgi:hypothetical protein
VTAPYCDVVRGTQQVKLHKAQAELSAIFANKRVGIEIEQPVPEPKGTGRRFGPRCGHRHRPGSRLHSTSGRL